MLSVVRKTVMPYNQFLLVEGRASWSLVKTPPAVQEFNFWVGKIHWRRGRLPGSPPGSPVPGILQARVLEWGAIAFSIREEGPTIRTQFKIVKNISDSESGLFYSVWDKFYGRLWKLI